MSSAPRPPSLLSLRLLVAGVMLLGLAASLFSSRAVRSGERADAETEFYRRASVRHALNRQVLTRYEDALFSLSSLLMIDGHVTRSDFDRAAQPLAERTAGVQAFEWVPLVTRENRAAFETAMRASYPGQRFEFTEADGSGKPAPATARPVYFPISYVLPLAGNEIALGYDPMTGATRPWLERARETRQMTATAQVRLVQEMETQPGVIMIWPVYRPSPPESSVAGDVFVGYLQGVFRVRELLEHIRSTHPDSILDLLFIDTSETDPAKRILYHRPADDAAPRTSDPGSEADFRAGLFYEQAITIGGRTWRVLYRPRAGWIESQLTSTPLLRSCGLVLLSLLVSSLIYLAGRRTETITREVAERTAELAESRRHFASMLHAVPGMAYRCRYDDQLSVLFVSEGSLALTGWRAEDLISGSVQFRDLIHPDDLPRVRDATRTGLQQHRDVEVEYRIRHRDGTEKWVLSRGRGVYTEAGKLEVFEGLAIDITAQKNSEAGRLALERKLLEGQKLESLGVLAGGIAHDFNNLLTGILCNASLVRLALPPSSDTQPLLGAIESSSLRAAELCRQMLAYAGKGRFVVEPADLSALAEGSRSLLEISVGRRTELRLDLARGLPAVLADAAQIRQVVMNLVLNAAEAVGERGGQITVATGVIHADRAQLARCAAGADLPARDYVFLEVRDNGAGMSPEVLAKIFDPFFSTKFAGRGLGLAAVIGIVRGHSGALSVDSTPGRGAVFRLLLPPLPGASPSPAVTASQPPTKRRWMHAGRILLIEDDDPVRFVTGEMLKTFGLATEIAADGEAGLALFRKNPAAYDLVMLDLLMPGLSGEDTLRELRALRPEVRVLLVSGYSEGDIIGRLADSHGGLAFLPKPFTRDTLEKKLREMLG